MEAETFYLSIELEPDLILLVFLPGLLISVVVQGLSIRPLLSRLGLTRPSEKQREFEEALARIVAAEASSSALHRMRDEHLLSKAVVDRLQQRFDDWIEARSRHLFKLVAEEPSLAEANVRLMQQEMGHAQKQALLRLLQRGSISEDVYAEFTANIDELLRSPSTMDWILAAELRERLEHPHGMRSSEQPPAGEPEAGA